MLILGPNLLTHHQSARESEQTSQFSMEQFGREAWGFTWGFFSGTLQGLEMESPAHLAPAVIPVAHMRVLEGMGFLSGLVLSPLLIIHGQTFLCTPPPGSRMAG